MNDCVDEFHKWADTWRHPAKRYNEPSIQHTWDCAWYTRQAEIEVMQQTIATQQARIEAALEVYAGMEGFIPETAAEGYCLRIIEQMNEALQEQTP